MENSNLQLTDLMKSDLSQAAKWAKFLSIVGFVSIGILVLAAIFVGGIMNTAGAAFGESAALASMSSILPAIYIVFAIIYFFPTFYFYRFSDKMLRAINTSNDEDLGLSFKNLKLCFKFIGILYIIIFSIYFLSILAAILFSAAAATR